MKNKPDPNDVEEYTTLKEIASIVAPSWWFIYNNRLRSKPADEFVKGNCDLVLSAARKDYG